MSTRFCFLVFLAAALINAAGADAAETKSPDLAKYEQRVDESVEKALAFLAKNQVPGALSQAPLAGSFHSPDMPGNTGISSLCVMAFLAKGHTPGSGRYGDVINKGIDYILSRQRSNGIILADDKIGPMYSHCISTLLLAEVSGMVDPERQKKIDAVLPKALKLILDAQQVKKAPQYAGGWRYVPTSPDSDLSLTGWAVMALRAARLNGAPVPKEAIDSAVSFVLRCRASDGGFCYQPEREEGSGLARTGLAVLCLQVCGQHQHEATKAGGNFILRHLPGSLTDVRQGPHVLYGIYYCSQAMFQLGGKYWEAWATRAQRILLASQRPDGSWPSDGTIESPYPTALAVLALGVVYQQLPIYQR